MLNKFIMIYIKVCIEQLNKENETPKESDIMTIKKYEYRDGQMVYKYGDGEI